MKHKWVEGVVFHSLYQKVVGAMKKYQKEVLQDQLNKEKVILNQLKIIYQEALVQVNERIKILQFDETQAKIYQREYQESLKKQLEQILDAMSKKEYNSIQEYLDECYRDGFLGTLYAMQQQGVPLMMPMDQEAMVKAIQIDSKISEGLYEALGVDTVKLKKVIASEITRGIATAMPYTDISRNVNNAAKTGYSNAERIVRTEGHRIQQTAAFDCAKEAKKRGAEVVKVWDSTLDGATRPVHRELDGQIREIDEPFTAHGKKAMFPGDFGDPAEDCNCRCTMLEKSRWELDDNETKWLGRTEDMTDEQLQPIADKLHIPVSELRKYGNQIIPVKASSYKDFVQQYNRIWNYENSAHKENVDARRAGKK